MYSHANIVLWALLLIALLRIAVLARDVVRMLEARKRVRIIDPPVSLDPCVTRPFIFAASNDFTSPCVLGFSPALIVLPEELLADAQAKLHSIVLHEREHVLDVHVTDSSRSGELGGAAGQPPRGDAARRWCGHSTL